MALWVLGTPWLNESDANPPGGDTNPPEGDNPWHLLFSSSMDLWGQSRWMKAFLMAIKVSMKSDPFKEELLSSEICLKNIKFCTVIKCESSQTVSFYQFNIKCKYFIVARGRLGYYSIQFFLHKQSFGVLLTETYSCLQLYGNGHLW